MICRYHPSAHQDVFEILDYYDSISAELGDAFYNELMDVVGGEATQYPPRFRNVTNRFRRSNLKRFPYHFLFEQMSWGIRVLVVKHIKRRLEYGTKRK